jgi:hypothetical protein
VIEEQHQKRPERLPAAMSAVCGRRLSACRRRLGRNTFDDISRKRASSGSTQTCAHPIRERRSFLLQLVTDTVCSEPSLPPSATICLQHALSCPSAPPRSSSASRFVLRCQISQVTKGIEDLSAQPSVPASSRSTRTEVK